MKVPSKVEAFYAFEAFICHLSTTKHVSLQIIYVLFVLFLCTFESHKGVCVWGINLWIKKMTNTPTWLCSNFSVIYIFLIFQLNVCDAACDAACDEVEKLYKSFITSIFHDEECCCSYLKLTQLKNIRKDTESPDV